jgi:hypothetical protein
MTGAKVDLLKEELAGVKDARAVLEHSFTICKTIPAKDDYDLSALDAFEALTSRFARLDILTQKIFRLIDDIELEADGTLRDRLNRAEKRGIVASAAALVEIRELRNEIAHVYRPIALRDLFRDVVRLTPALFDTVDRLFLFATRY